MLVCQRIMSIIEYIRGKKTTRWTEVPNFFGSIMGWLFKLLVGNQLLRLLRFFPPLHQRSEMVGRLEVKLSDTCLLLIGAGECGGGAGGVCVPGLRNQNRHP